MKLVVLLSIVLVSANVFAGINIPTSAEFGITRLPEDRVGMPATLINKTPGLRCRAGMNAPVSILSKMRQGSTYELYSFKKAVALDLPETKEGSYTYQPCLERDDSTDRGACLRRGSDVTVYTVSYLFRMTETPSQVVWADCSSNQPLKIEEVVLELRSVIELN